MKEIIDIIASYNHYKKTNEQVALATVVHVEGSSYRKPGARMLVNEKGLMTGAISGGCLEGDALRKALSTIALRKNKIVTYDTTDEDVTFGVQLGCNGIVHILFEPIDFANPNNAVELLQQSLIAKRTPVVLCTLFTLNVSAFQIGTALLFMENKKYSNLPDPYTPLIDKLAEDASRAFELNTSSIRQYKINETLYNGFIELIKPAISLVIVGAGNDAQPVAVAAKNLGWQIVLIDGRTSHASKKRFPQADKIIVDSPAKALANLPVDNRTAFVLMTHNYNYDKAMLELLIDQPTQYIGCLGPKKKLNRMLTEIQDQGMPVTDIARAKIYGPIGLEIGAETSEEVAISIIAEIQGVMHGKRGTSLRLIDNTIHERFNGDYLIPVFIQEKLSNKNEKSEDDVFTCSIDLPMNQ